jgi:hypothetical protein
VAQVAELFGRRRKSLLIPDNGINDGRGVSAILNARRIDSVLLQNPGLAGSDVTDVPVHRRFIALQLGRLVGDTQIDNIEQIVDFPFELALCENLARQGAFPRLIQRTD